MRAMVWWTLFLVFPLALQAQTGLTASATEGPYFVTGTGPLVRGELNAKGFPGTPVVISGKVYSGATGTVPVAGAKIELWQADASGRYHPAGNGPASQYSSSQLALRGYVLSSADGSYEFSTIYPGYYEGRARHLHFRVSAPGYQAVTSQLIFTPKAGDRVTMANDRIAQALPRSHWLQVNESVSPAAASFDIRLAP